MPTTRMLGGTTDGRRAGERGADGPPPAALPRAGLVLVAAVALVVAAGAPAPLSPVGVAVADAGVAIVDAETSPAPGTELTPGETYTFDVAAKHWLDGADSATVELFFEGISAGAEDTVEVTADGTTTLSGTTTIPSDWNTNNDLQVTLRIQGPDGIDTHTARYPVTSPNDPPSIDGSQPSGTTPVVAVGGTIHFSVSASDPDGDDLSYDWYHKPADAYGHVGTGSSYAHTFEAAGTEYVKVEVNDGQTTVSKTWIVEVEETNQDRAPSISRVAPSADSIALPAGAGETFAVEVTDPDRDLERIDWRVDGATEHTRYLGGEETQTDDWQHAFEGDGTRTVEAVVVDGNGNTDSLSWRVDVRSSAPGVATDAASGVGETRATLEGRLTDLGTADAADVRFEYREDGAGSWQRTTWTAMGGTGPFARTVEGLRSGATYEFRAVARSDAGTTTAGARTFETTAPLDGDVQILDAGTTPAPGTELSPGETYAVDVEVDYELAGADSGTVALVFEGVSSGEEDATTVSAGSATTTLGADLRVPGDWSTDDDLEVRVVLEAGDLRDVDAVTYPVASENAPPEFESVDPADPTLSAAVGEPVAFAARADDPDGDRLEYGWYVDAGDGFRRVDAGEATTRAFDSPGTYRVRVEVTDGTATATRTWSVEAVAEGRPPSIERVSPSSPSVRTADAETFEVEASDPDGDAARIEWTVDGRAVATTALGGGAVHLDALTYAVDGPGDRRLAATVVDDAGNRDSVSWTVSGAATATPPTTTPTTSGPSTDTEPGDATPGASIRAPENQPRGELVELPAELAYTQVNGDDLQHLGVDASDVLARRDPDTGDVRSLLVPIHSESEQTVTVTVGGEDGVVAEKRATVGRQERVEVELPSDAGMDYAVVRVQGDQSLLETLFGELVPAGWVFDSADTLENVENGPKTYYYHRSTNESVVVVDMSGPPAAEGLSERARGVRRQKAAETGKSTIDGILDLFG